MVDELIRYIWEKLGLVVESRIQEGHLGLPIYRCSGSGGQRFVIKVGIGEEGKREVEDNKFGYEEIKRLGAGVLVPDFRLIETPYGPTLLMEDLGGSFRNKAQSAEATAEMFEVFKKIFLLVTRDTLTYNFVYHVNGLDEIVGQIRKWGSQLSKHSLLEPELLEDLQKINTPRIAGNYSSLMLLDLTPDNIFVNNGRVKFIDPWRQTTYLATPIPGISQFVTLSEEIYEIPGFSDSKLNYSAFFEELKDILGLSDRQLRAQIYLGRALQFSLSSFVRIENNLERARFYASLVEENIRLLTK